MTEPTIQILIQEQLYDLHKKLHDGIFKKTKIDTTTLFNLAQAKIEYFAKTETEKTKEVSTEDKSLHLSEAEAFATKYQNFINLTDFKQPEQFKKDVENELEKAKQLLAIVDSILLTEIAASSVEISIADSTNSNQSSIHENFIASILPNDTILTANDTILTDSNQNTDIALGSIASTIATIISSIVLSSGLSSGPIQATTLASSGLSSGPIQGTTIGTIIESATSIIDTSIIEKTTTFTSGPIPGTTATSGPIPGTVKTVTLSSNKNFDLNKPLANDNIDATLEVLHKLVILGGMSDVAAPELKTYIISQSKTDIMEGHFIVTGHLRCIDGIVIPPSLSDIDHIFVARGQHVEFTERLFAIRDNSNSKENNYFAHANVDKKAEAKDVYKAIHGLLKLDDFCKIGTYPSNIKNKPTKIQALNSSNISATSTNKSNQNTKKNPTSLNPHVRTSQTRKSRP